jgi:UDP-N-acetylglucosamine transferase subunit ALG13
VIFVTVGTQGPFPRLLDWVAAWATRHPRLDIVAQVHTADPQAHAPFACVPHLDMPAFMEHVERADFVVSHAGTGNIISCIERGKPVVVVPRLHALGEHRNDHQVDTCAQFDGRPLVHVVHTREAFDAVADRLLAGGAAAIATAAADAPARAMLIRQVRAFVFGTQRQPEPAAPPQAAAAVPPRGGSP